MQRGRGNLSRACLDSSLTSSEELASRSRVSQRMDDREESEPPARRETPERRADYILARILEPYSCVC